MHSTRKMAKYRWPILVLSLALLAPGACTPDKKAQEELHQQIKGLKAEIKGLQEKMDKLERGQQEILQLLHKPAPPPPPAAAAPPATPEPLSLGQLLKDKERLQGTRVTVRGMPGTVLVHRQTLIMRAPEGMVDVYFGAIPDTLTINRLTSTNLDHPVTVTGILSLSPKGVGNPKINAEAIEF
ncbi:MAG: hypothetical protein PHU44_11390 [Syntrophales bacterium]|nr:hypothetical protein [Syntrophales bacterium]MDD5642545.1 hypothetical protein [Syntrophales bacterium]